MAWTLDAFRSSRRPATLATVYDAFDVIGALPRETPVYLYDWPGSDTFGAYVILDNDGFVVDLAAHGTHPWFAQLDEAEAYLFEALTDEEA